MCVVSDSVVYYPQSTRLVPKVEFEDQLAQTNGPSYYTPALSTSLLQNTPGTRLSHYLNSLATRPNDAPYDLDDANFRTSASMQELSASISASVSSSSNLGLLSVSNAPHLGHSNVNPEADSFTYVETLLESLAVLGKLGSALDSVMQRLQGEIYSLIELTIDEVEERAEESKRSSVLLTAGALGSKSDGGYIFVSDDSATMSSAHAALGRKTPSTTASTLRLAALESTSKHHDQEILKDLFWSIYSKLDAVTQGLRVVSEVTNRIGSVSAIEFNLHRISMLVIPFRDEISRTLLVPSRELSFPLPMCGCQYRLRFFFLQVSKLSALTKRLIGSDSTQRLSYRRGAKRRCGSESHHLHQ